MRATERLTEWNPLLAADMAATKLFAQAGAAGCDGFKIRFLSEMEVCLGSNQAYGSERAYCT